MDMDICRMKIYKLTQQLPKSLIGYKIVAFNGKYAYSLYNTNIKIPLTLNTTFQDPKGFYLGTSKDFCINYYSGGTNDKDLLLTYQYQPENLLKGDPLHSNGEVIVNKATLTNIEELPQWKYIN